MSTKPKHTAKTNPDRPARADSAADLGRMGHEQDDTRELEENQVASSQDHSDDDERSIDSGEDRGDDAGVLEHR